MSWPTFLMPALARASVGRLPSSRSATGRSGKPSRFRGFLISYILLAGLQLFIEAVDLTLDVNNTLHLTAEEGVTIGADFNANFLLG